MFREYKRQLTRANLFDQYIQIRAKELIKQNLYLLQHEGTLKIESLRLWIVFWVSIYGDRCQESYLLHWRSQRNSDQSSQTSQQPRCKRFQGLWAHPSGLHQKIFRREEGGPIEQSPNDLTWETTAYKSKNLICAFCWLSEPQILF